MRNHEAKEKFNWLSSQILNSNWAYFFYETVTTDKFNVKTFKIMLYFDFYKSATDPYRGGSRK